MKFLFSAFLCNLLFISTYAAPKYWIGPANGNWSNSANWSLSSKGVGFTGVPEIEDSVIFLEDALINLDINPTVASLTIGSYPTIVSVKFYTARETAFTVVSTLLVDTLSTLKDSTSSDVGFNMIFKGSNQARGLILGIWEFEGGIPVSATRGAFFTTEDGARVSIGSNSPTSTLNSAVISKGNSGDIHSTKNSLTFNSSSSFVIQDHVHPLIPAATWVGRNITGATGIISLGCAIKVLGMAGNIRHALSGQSYGDWFVDLPYQLNDISLAFSNGTLIQGNLTINNSNGKTITLLSNESLENNVGISHVFIEPTGDLIINGSTTKVALSTVNQTDSFKRYRLVLTGSFLQDGGNFSLQDNNQPGGSATLAVAGRIRQTSGTFFTNSNVEEKDLTVEMIGPNYRLSPAGSFISGQGIHLSSGTIDNSRHSVKLKINQRIIGPSFKRGREVGIVLSTPVTVGKLDLITGIVYSSKTNLLTIQYSTQPAITQVDPTNTNVPNYYNGYSSSYIVGPFQFYTTSSRSYIIPTGSAPTYTPSYYTGGTRDSNMIYHKSTASILPGSSLLSQYRAEYFESAYIDSINYASPLQTISKDKYWEITKVSGADASISLDLSDSIKGSSVDNAVVVAQYQNDKWVAVNGSVLTPGNIQTGSVTSRVLKGLGTFTFGSISATNIPLDVRFTGFSARKTIFGATLDWSVESPAARFEILRSFDSRSFIRIGDVDFLGNSKHYQFQDNKMLPGINYYRIKSVESNGNIELSQIKAVTDAPRKFTLNFLAPSEVTESAILSFDAITSGKISLIISDNNGRIIQRVESAVKEGSNNAGLKLGHLKVGTYQIVGVMNGISTRPLRFIKRN
jgi:hypothetical protein